VARDINKEELNIMARDINKEELNIMNIIMKNKYFVPVPLIFIIHLKFGRFVIKIR